MVAQKMSTHEPDGNANMIIGTVLQYHSTSTLTKALKHETSPHYEYPQSIIQYQQKKNYAPQLFRHYSKTTNTLTQHSMTSTHSTPKKSSTS